MSDIEEIFHDGKLMAVVVRKGFDKGGINFISMESFPLQVGINFYKKGDYIKPHLHPKRKIVINDVHEFIRVEEGKMKASLYEENGKIFKSMELYEGDMILLIEGGHSFEIMENTKLSEVKQGPYMGKEVDKKMIDVL